MIARGILAATVLAVASPAVASDWASAIRAINAQITPAMGPLAPLTMDCVSQWYGTNRLFAFQKADRQTFDTALAAGRTPDGFSLTIDQQPYPGIPTRIDLTQPPNSNDDWIIEYTLVDGPDCDTWAHSYLAEIQELKPALDEPELTGQPAPDGATGDFPSSVPVQIKQIALTLDQANVPALDIQFQIRRDNIADLARYFGTGYSSAETQTQLLAMLGTADSRWIGISSIFRGWPAQWVNKFPAQYLDPTGKPGNDVCFGVSRQFFRDELANGGLDRASESTEYLLQTQYRLLPENAQPTFGDYLYLPRQHAIRFIMKDPASSRWIGFTAWSDSHTPYRLWWVDQDYVRPIDVPQPPTPDPSFPKKMDLWRKK